MMKEQQQQMIRRSEIDRKQQIGDWLDNENLDNLILLFLLLVQTFPIVAVLIIAMWSFLVSN